MKYCASIHLPALLIVLGFSSPLEEYRSSRGTDSSFKTEVSAVSRSRGNSGRPPVLCAPSSSLPFLSGCQVRRKRKKAFAFLYAFSVLPRSAPEPSSTPEPDPVAAAPGHLPPLISRWTALIVPARHSFFACWAGTGRWPDFTSSDERLWWALALGSGRCPVGQPNILL